MAKIIVVDDSKLMRTILKGALEGAGHAVELWDVIAATEVPSRLQASNPELLITDYQMPGCNGATLARLAQRTKPGLPIILITAHRDPSVLESMEKLGIRTILHKPVNAQALIEAVHDLLEPEPYSDED